MLFFDALANDDQLQMIFRNEWVSYQGLNFFLYPQQEIAEIAKTVAADDSLMSLEDRCREFSIHVTRRFISSSFIRNAFEYNLAEEMWKAQKRRWDHNDVPDQFRRSNLRRRLAWNTLSIRWLADDVEELGGLLEHDDPDS